MGISQNNRAHFEKNVEAPASSVLNWQQSSNGLCSIRRVKAALLHDRILFTSENLHDEDNRLIQPAHLYSISLDRSHRVDELLHRDALSFATATGEQFPDLTKISDGPFWYDDSSLYALSAESDSPESSRRLWSLEVLEGSPQDAWQPLASVGALLLQRDLSDVAHADTPEFGLSFVADISSNGDAKVMMLNTTTSGDPTWENLNPTIPADRQRNGASMFFAPYGEKGVLFFLGGDSLVGDHTTFMKEVEIFDLASSKWFRVQTVPYESTAGTTKESEYPEPRRAFCGWSAEDNSSYSIVIYGGMDLGTSEPYGDIWALSIPSFQWIKLDQDEDKAVPAHSHVCIKHRENYGFVLGGHRAKNENETSCWGAPAVRLFDLSLLQWVDEFTLANAAEYRANEKIAIKDTKPDLSEDLRDILNTRISQSDPKTPSGDNPSTSTTATPSSNSTSTNLLSIGAKVGIGLGISIFILLLALGALFFLKRRRRHQSAQPPTSKRLPTDDFQAEDLVTKNTAHVETRYRGSVSPPGLHADSDVQTQPHASVMATSGPFEQQGRAHGLPPRDEVHSSTSHYSNDVLNYHHGEQQHEHATNDERERRPSLDSVVSSLAETTVPAQVEEPNSDARAGVSPILSPVSPVRTSHEEEFRLDEQPSSTTK